VANVDFSAPTSRASQILAGLVTTILGAALLLFGAFVIWRLLGHHPDKPAMIVLCIVFGLGLPLFIPGLRLLTGRRRHDGGLFSPWVLRFGGLIFFAGPVAILFLSPSVLGLLKSAFSIGAGVACFALANRRQDRGLESNANVPNQRLERPVKPPLDTP
jgi:hypothetical protein